MKWLSLGPTYRLAACVLLILSGLLLACGGGGDDSTESPDSTSPASSSSPAADATATRVAPTAAPNPELENRIAQAYRENRTFVPRASVDELKVTFDGATGLVTVSIRPLPTSENTIGGNSKFLGGPSNDALQITAQSAVVAGKVIWASFPEVKTINVAVSTEFRNAAGGSIIDTAATITVVRATGEKMDFEALKTSVPAQPRSYFCAADGYMFNAAVYNSITDKGCLTGALKSAPRP